MKTIDFNDECSFKKIGSYKGQCENITQFFESFPMIHYVKGIPEFDSFLKNKKFAETRLNHVIIIYENAVVFQLYLEKNGELIAGIWKSEIKKIVPHYKQKIEVRSVNRFSKALKSGSFGFINAVVGAASDKIIDSTRGLTYKEVSGAIYEIWLDDFDNQENQIIVSCESSSIYKTNEFFNNYLGCNFK